jgi:hypothetical protein
MILVDEFDHIEERPDSATSFSLVTLSGSVQAGSVNAAAGWHWGFWVPLALPVFI